MNPTRTGPSGRMIGSSKGAFPEFEDTSMADNGGNGGNGGTGGLILFYACSGGANVAEVADRAARELMAAGEGKMFCLAGLGAGLESMVAQAREADLNVVIDGCEVDCAKRIFDNAGLTNYIQVRVTDAGLEKSKGERATGPQVAAIVERVRKAMSDA
jgi:uncharacterized metal-binding protein